MATVSYWLLEDSNFIICQIVGNHQAPHFIFRLSVHHLTFKPHDFAGVQHQLFQVHFRRLWLNHAAVDQGVLFATNSIVGRRRQLQVRHRFLGNIQASLTLVNVHVLLVELLCRIITVVDHQLSPPNVDGLSHSEVVGVVDLAFCCKQAWYSQDLVLLGQGAALHEHRIGIASRVAAVSLVDLHRVVRQEVVDDEIDPRSIRCMIIPICLEAKHLPFIEGKLGEFHVHMRSPAHVLCQVFGINRSPRQRHFSSFDHLLQLVGLLPLVLDDRFFRRKPDAILLKEPAGKSVASIDVNGAAVDGDLLAHLQIIGSQIGHAILPHHFLSLQEGALSEARIFHLGLVHAHGAIFHMEHDGHVSVAGILVRPLRDRLLEEAVEAQDLLVMFQPGRCLSWMSHISGDHLLLSWWRFFRLLSIHHPPACSLQKSCKLSMLLRRRWSFLPVHC
mmetsp:Transcript_42728/g.87285  ORF Transcript_42728/g.87285 Transcript_42728/m.87285 type:complete len:445 (-) Transcript_42728:204-1538(-)